MHIPPSYTCNTTTIPYHTHTIQHTYNIHTTTTTMHIHTTISYRTYNTCHTTPPPHVWCIHPPRPPKCRSYYRCIVIHGTNRLQVRRNVAFHVSGSCYYLEDGVEEQNWLEGNLAAYVHPVGGAVSGWNQLGSTHVQVCVGRGCGLVWGGGEGLRNVWVWW